MARWPGERRAELQLLLGRKPWDGELSRGMATFFRGGVPQDMEKVFFCQAGFLLDRLILRAPGFREGINFIKRVA